VQAAIAELDTEKAATGHAHSGTYVPLATIDAAGDLLVGTANDTIGRLAMGSALQSLRVNSGATGLEFAAAGGGAIAEGRANDGTSRLSMPGADGTSGSTITVLANTIYYTPWYVVTDITIDQIVIGVSTAGVASTNARLGIYNADTSWQPTTLVLDAGVVSVASTGAKAISISQVLPAGRYQACLVSDGAPVLRGALRGSRFYGYATSIGTSASIFTATLQAALAYGALPTPAGAATFQPAVTSVPISTVFCRVSTP
jgi:hypothetical protein